MQPLLVATDHPTDAYHWVAQYDDDSELWEYDEDGTDHGFREIDQTRLARLVLVPQRAGLSAHVLRLTGGQRPIFFRRRTLSLDPLTDEQNYLGTRTVLGWQDTVGGVNVKAITCYYDDGSSVVTNDPEAI